MFTGQPGYAFDRQEAPRQENCPWGQGLPYPHFAALAPAHSRQGHWRLAVLHSLVFLSCLHPHYRKALLLVTTEPPYLPVVAYIMHWLFNQPYVCLLYDLYPDVAVTLGVVTEKKV